MYFINEALKIMILDEEAPLFDSNLNLDDSDNITSIVRSMTPAQLGYYKGLKNAGYSTADAIILTRDSSIKYPHKPVQGVTDEEDLRNAHRSRLTYRNAYNENPRNIFLLNKDYGGAAAYDTLINYGYDPATAEAAVKSGLTNKNGVISNDHLQLAKTAERRANNTDRRIAEIQSRNQNQNQNQNPTSTAATLVTDTAANVGKAAEGAVYYDLARRGMNLAGQGLKYGKDKVVAGGIAAAGAIKAGLLNPITLPATAALLVTGGAVGGAYYANKEWEKGIDMATDVDIMDRYAEAQSRIDAANAAAANINNPNIFNNQSFHNMVQAYVETGKVPPGASKNKEFADAFNEIIKQQSNFKPQDMVNPEVREKAKTEVKSYNNWTIRDSMKANVDASGPKETSNQLIDTTKLPSDPNVLAAPVVSGDSDSESTPTMFKQVKDWVNDHKGITYGGAAAAGMLGAWMLYKWWQKRKKITEQDKMRAEQANNINPSDLDPEIANTPLEAAA